MALTRAASLALLLSSIPLSALAAEPESWEKICEQARKTPIPKEDRASAEDAKTLAGCNSEALYFGIGIPADPGRARRCAYLELEKEGGSDVWSGANILMMVYANGVGAKRNFDFALRFACDAGGAEAEMEGRIEHLAKLRRENWKGHDFSICDDISSGFMSGFCADHEERIADARRATELARTQAKWSAAEKAAFDQLQGAFNRYMELHSNNEVDQSGTARGAFVVGAQSKLKKSFLKLLADLESGKYPKDNTRALKLADRDLDAIYKKVMNHKNPEDWGTVTLDGIKTTQRIWLQFRGAWLDFAKAKYPRASLTGLQTVLTKERTAQLREFLTEG